MMLHRSTTRRRCRRPARFSLAFLLVLFAAGRFAHADPPVTTPSPSASDADVVDVEFARHGGMRMTLLDQSLELETPYGPLRIPARQIVAIEFATRLSDDDTTGIAVAIGGLASSEFPVRKAATAKLLAYGPRAYPALVRAAADSDAEVAKRAAAVAATLEVSYPAQQLAVREFDVIETAHSKIAGRLAAESLAVETVEFGSQRLRLCDVRSLRSERAPKGPAYIKPEPDPGTMSAFQNQIGKTFAFTVTGQGHGGVYGTELYTADSSIAIAAVHSGVLKPGETAVIHVQMVPSPPSFTASTKNGITSSTWGSYPAAYRILGKGPATP